MLLHSHTHGEVILLPSLPNSLKKHGSAEGLLARGDIAVNMLWRKGSIKHFSLYFKKYNPALSRLDQVIPGYFNFNTSKTAENKAHLQIFYPGKEAVIKRSFISNSAVDLKSSLQSENEAGQSCARWSQEKSSIKKKWKKDHDHHDRESAVDGGFKDPTKHSRYNSGDLQVDSFPCFVSFEIGNAEQRSNL
jgi:hypothetical protein